jgi:hypothetical protein
MNENDPQVVPLLNAPAIHAWDTFRELAQCVPVGYIQLFAGE